ncbi:hypothetical protein DES52_11683 [Deinococcus yavapaiensis KR-236]|uniref:AhpC/TSA family protein n=2 Tax=Deinococcus TaxID=1298 RepID=A0A318S1A7_9DEIO|nr:hypothetical protein DES52_11683 [Deinococcus yavapaiensis KR-236]
MFFNLECAACVTRGLPFLKRVHHEYGGRVNILAIHMARGHRLLERDQVEPTVRRFAESFANLPFPVALDLDGHIAEALQTEGTPHWLAFTVEGTLLRSVYGRQENAQTRLEYLLAELGERWRRVVPDDDEWRSAQSRVLRGDEHRVQRSGAGRRVDFVDGRGKPAFEVIGLYSMTMISGMPSPVRSWHACTSTAKFNQVAVTTDLPMRVTRAWRSSLVETSSVLRVYAPQVFVTAVGLLCASA